MLLKYLAFALLLGNLLTAQTKPREKICPIKLAMFPVPSRSEVPLNRQARFEIRTCEEGYPVQLLGFQVNEARPTLFIDTQQSSISLLIHKGTVLFLQMAAGSSSPAWVVQFQNGVPKLIDGVDGVGGVSYGEEYTDRGDYVVITVPRKTFPDASGKFPRVPPRRFRLKTYD